MVSSAHVQEGLARRRLLIVEDNDDTAHVLKFGLEQLGYVVEIAHNGPLALRLAKGFQPEVALLDIGLPVMDGWELARRLRGQHADLQLIAVTGMAEDAARVRSADAGFADHLLKPVDIDAIDAAVRRLS
jgi:DNA-binding response OmpR family regulator